MPVNDANPWKDLVELSHAPGNGVPSGFGVMVVIAEDGPVKVRATAKSALLKVFAEKGAAGVNEVFGGLQCSGHTETFLLEEIRRRLDRALGEKKPARRSSGSGAGLWSPHSSRP
jgi:hypothetical protein